MAMLRYFNIVGVAACGDEILLLSFEAADVGRFKDLCRDIQHERHLRVSPSVVFVFHCGFVCLAVSVDARVCTERYRWHRPMFEIDSLGDLPERQLKPREVLQFVGEEAVRQLWAFKRAIDYENQEQEPSDDDRGRHQLQERECQEKNRRDEERKYEDADGFRIVRLVRK